MFKNVMKTLTKQQTIHVKKLKIPFKNKETIANKTICYCKLTCM